MILARTRETLRHRGSSTLSEVAAELSVHRAQADAALSYWVHRGSVEVAALAAPKSVSAACSGCAIASRCGAQQSTDHPIRIYRWIE